jgi:putative hydrolase of the HAD superfamily
MAAVLELTRQEFENLYWRFRPDYDEARLDPEEYWNGVARAAGRMLSSSQIKRVIELDSFSWMYPRTVIADWARALKQAGSRIALLSNMPVTLRDALQSCAWLPEFDQRTLSCDVKVSKPSAGIYQHCLNRLGLAPSDVLFLDDREPNVRAARELGMHALRFTNVASVTHQLKDRFDVPAPSMAAWDTGGSAPA